jgi:predicted DNA-binding transcriptional regulator YafY
MENIELLDTPACELPEGEFDVVEYSRKLFGMYGGEEELIRLQFDNSLIGVVLDRFGMDADIQKADEHSFVVTFHAFVSPTLLGWIFEFTGKVKVLEPESLKQKLRMKAMECLKMNSDDRTL